MELRFMTIRIEKSGFVWTIIHSRPEARGAMDPEQANVLYEAFLAFNADDNAYVAVFGVRVAHSVLAGISNMLPVWMLMTLLLTMNSQIQIVIP